MSKQENPRNTARELAQLTDDKRALWARRFVQLYAESFTKRWPEDALRQVWWPILDDFTLPEIEAALVELSNERKERHPPQPAEWRDTLRRQSMRLREQRKPQKTFPYQPMSEANVERIQKLNRELGLPEFQIPDWARSANGR